jgi:two-component system sensor histidine kinase MprB
VPLLPSGALQLGRDVSDIEAAKQAILRWLFAIGTAAVLVAAAVAWLVARGLSNPIRTLARTTEDIARTRDFSATVPVPPEHEVAQLAGGVNTLLAAIRESRDRQTRLVQDASHELRTPLTSIRANADLLVRGNLDGATARAAIGDIRAEVEALSRLSSELVELATDARAIEDPVDLDLVELAHDVADRAHRRTGRTVRVVPPPTGAARAPLRPQQADRAIGNLVDNALKFSQGDVEIVVREDGIEVRDRGPGITDTDKARVFDRFWRADASRALPGSGLGLAIVKQFADDHDATVKVGDNPGGGTTVAIRFPSPR